MSKNKKILGLVSMMSPIELMKSLMNSMELLPKEAAQVVYGLKKRTENEGLSGPGIETNKMYPVPPTMKDDEDSVEELSLRVGPSDDGTGKFPPAPREKPGDFPYDSVFVNYMNSPKRKKPIMSGLEPKVKKNNPLDVIMQLLQPGGYGNATNQKTYQSRDGDMPGQGSSWSRQGKAGWSSTPRDKEFEIPPKSIKKAGPVEFSQPLAGGQANHPPNAGDSSEDDGVQFLKDPNVGQTIWVPGKQNVRSAPYRGYRRR